MSSVKLESLLTRSAIEKVVMRIVRFMQDKKPLNQLLVTDRDFDFLLPCLQSAITFRMENDVIDIYEKILKSPQSENGLIKDIDTYNRYARRVLVELPAAMDQDIRDPRKVIQVLVRSMGSDFDKETWAVALSSLLECIGKCPQSEKSEQMSKFATAFRDANLDVPKANELVKSYCRLCFCSVENGPDRWDDLFKELFAKLMSTTDEQKQKFIMSVIMTMKQLGKQIDEGAWPEGTEVTRPVRGFYFKLALLAMKMEAHRKSVLFKGRILVEPILRMFADGIFVDGRFLERFEEKYVSDHLKNVFKAFSYGTLPRSSSWHAVFVKYICNLLVGRSDFRPSLVSSVINHAAWYSEEAPENMMKLVFSILTVSDKLVTRKVILDTVKPIWPNLLANSIDLARADGDTDLETNLKTVIRKLTAVELQPTKDVLAIYLLVLDIVAGNEEGVAKRLSHLTDNFRHVYKNSNGIVAYFSVITLAILPYYTPDFGASINHCSSLAIVPKISGPLSEAAYTRAFLLSVLEIAGKSLFFVKYRQSFRDVFNFVKLIVKESGDEGGRKSLKDIATLGQAVMDALLYKPFPACQCHAFENSFDRRVTVVLNGTLVTLCESDSTEKVGITVRTIAGASMLEVNPDTEISTAVPDEKSLQPNTLRRSEIDIDGFAPFRPLKQATRTVIRSMALTLLSSLGVVISPSETKLRLLKNGPELKAAIAELDMQTHVDFQIRLSNIGEDSTSLDEIIGTEQFARFKSDLGEHFDMSFCRFFFHTDTSTADNGILIVFNESDLRINSKEIGPTYKLVVSVSPVYRGLTKDALMYKVSVVVACEDSMILPFPQRSARVVPASYLARTIGTILFMHHARVFEDRTCGGAPRCVLVDGYENVFKERKRRIEEIVEKYTVEGEILSTLQEFL